MRLAAGLRPDPLGELQRFPRLPSRNRGRGPNSKRKGRRREREMEGKGQRREEGRRGEEIGREELGEGIASFLFNFWLRSYRKCRRGS